MENIDFVDKQAPTGGDMMDRYHHLYGSGTMDKLKNSLTQRRTYKLKVRSGFGILSF
jgi:hypothetical protein